MTNQHDQLHCDPDELALFALGETAYIDADHLQSCERCRAEAASLRRVVRTARTVESGDYPTMPDAQLWSAIRAEISTTEIPSGRGFTGISGNGSPTGVDLTSASAIDADGSHSNVVALRARRGPWIALAAVVGLVLGGIVGVAWWGTQTIPASVVAQAELTGLDGFAATGTAQVQVRDGFEVLEVDVTGLPETDGYFEVWLLTSDVDGMISLGALAGGTRTTLPLPPGIALDQFSIVDISEEMFDGDPTHSAVSVTRGELAT